MDESEEYGPALPPGMVAGDKAGQSDEGAAGQSKVLGPAIPGHLRKSTDSDELSDEGQLMVKMESDLSPEQSDSTVGPLPSEMASEGDATAKTAEEFEKRALRMKDKIIKGEPEATGVKRDEWMTELPPEMGKNFGLGNRQFSKGSGSQEDKDRSGWTETPIKKEKESKGKKRKRDTEEKVITSRDQKLHQQVEDYNKSNRSESLMDLHSKKQKKKKKKEKKEKKKKKERGEKEEKEERVPFDRDRDLKLQNIDDAQRKAFIKKSALLNTKFSFGERTSHFL